MSERDPIRDLENFGTGGVPVTPLAPADVRRLGDRRRTRRNALAAAGTVAAVALIAAPFALVTGGNGDPDPVPPATSPSQITQIPKGFPLDEGFETTPGKTRGPEHADLGITPVDLCGDIGWKATPIDVLGASHSGTEVSQSRELVLFSDETTAASEVARFRDQVAGCKEQTYTEPGGATTQVYTSERPAPVTEDNAGWQRNDDDSAFQIGSVTSAGNAVLLVTATASVPEGRQVFTTLHDDAVLRLSSSMCVFLPDGCSTPPPSSKIPADFPLDRGTSDLGPTSLRNGPAGNVQVRQPNPCNAGPLEGVAVENRLGFANHGEDFSDERELLLYADESTATEALTAVDRAVEECATDQADGITRTWTKLTADVGHPSVTFRQGVDGEMGGTTFQVTRVGRALLMVVWPGEGSGDVASMTDITGQITPEMCGWSSAGCVDGPAEGGQPSPGEAPEVVAIAADFPLAEGFPSQSEDGAKGYSGPNRTIPPLDFEVCGKSLADPAHQDRLLASYKSAEDYRTRQLTTYPDADEAVAASRALVEAYRNCPSEPAPEGHVDLREVQDLTLGGESWAILDRTTFNGSETPFGATIIVVRVGRAVIIEQHGGHAGYPNADGTADLSERLGAPIAAMCTFTAAGC